MEEEKKDKKKERSTVNRVVRFFISLIIIFIVWIAVTNIVGDQYVKYMQNKQEKTFTEEQAKAEEMLKSDTYGGKTPEETLTMFLDALKKNDAELASKYYVLDRQLEALKNLKDELAKNGSLNIGVVHMNNVITNGKKVCHDLDVIERAGCNFEYTYFTDKNETIQVQGSNNLVSVPKNSKEKVSIDLKLNQYTNIWKIAQP